MSAVNRSFSVRTDADPSGALGLASRRLSARPSGEVLFPLTSDVSGAIDVAAALGRL